MHWHNLVTFVQVWSLIDIICEIHVFQYHFQVRLSSKSPWDPPLVDPCYLCDQSDSELLVKAIQQTVDMVNGSSELKRLLSGISWPLFKCVLGINFIFSLWYNFCYVLETNKHFFERHGFELPDLHWPGCEEHLIFSAEYWTCYLSHVRIFIQYLWVKEIISDIWHK